MENSDLDQVKPVQPHLWNPNAAANWSILFSPAFGAYLHAANWRALGKPERARTNVIWFWVTIVFLIFLLGSIVAPESKHSEDAQRVVGIGLLLGWYFSQGRPQARYVKETHPDGYVKKPWGRPLLTGFSCLLGYFAVCVLLFGVRQHFDPEFLAAEIKPRILEEWEKKPELRGATIQLISLTTQDGKTYTGFVEATIGGKPMTLALEVTRDDQNVSWTLKAPGP